MGSAGISLAAGARVAVRYTREQTKGTLPAAVTTAVNNIASDSTGTGTSKFTRASGSFITDGFIAGQKVIVAGFADTDNNATWTVQSVSATELVVIDPLDVIGTEAAATGQTVKIQMIKQRVTGRAVNLTKATLESEEIDADGQDTDLRHGFNRVQGSLGFQFGLKDYDDPIELVMQNSFGAVNVTGGPLFAAVGGGSAGFTRTAGSFITDGFRPGDIIRTSGFDSTINNGDWLVLTVGAGFLVVYDPNQTIVSETSVGGTGRTISYPGRRVDVGTDLTTVTLERAFLDILRYQPFHGCGFDSWQMNVQPESMVGGSFGILGLRAAAMASSPLSSSAIVEPTGNSPMDAFTGVIFENGAATAVATAVSFTLARNMSLNPVIGSEFSPDLFPGQAKGNATLTAYFENEGLFNRFVNETESSMWFKFPDPNNPLSFISIVFPRIKYTGADMDPPQQGPVPIEMPFRFLKKVGLAVPGGLLVNSMMTVQVSNAAA